MFLNSIKKFVISKGLADAKVLLINASKVLNFQRPIGNFLKPSIVENFIISKLVYEVIKSLITSFYYIWEWFLMLLGIFICLFSLYVIIYPNGFLLTSFPFMINFFKFLEIESSMNFYESLKDLFFNPFSSTYFYVDYLYNKIINLNIYFFNITNYIFNIFVYFPYVMIINSWKIFKGVITFSSISFIFYFISKCWILFDVIRTSALDYMSWFPTSPQLWYYLVSSIDHVITQPFNNIARGSTSFYEVIEALIPSEKDILQHVINISTLGNYIR